MERQKKGKPQSEGNAGYGLVNCSLEFLSVRIRYIGRRVVRLFSATIFQEKNSRISESEPISAKYLAIIYRFFQYLTSVGDMMGLIIKKLTQVPQERFRLR